MNYPVDLSVHPKVESFFDEDSNTFTYVVIEPGGSACALIDPVLELDWASGATNTNGIGRVLAFIQDNSLDCQLTIETHVHADHLSAAPLVQQELGAPIGISEHVKTIQETFGKVFNEGSEFERDGSQFDRLFVDADTYQIGSMTGFAMHTPGHTPSCMVHVIGNAAFVGDTLFMPDGGTARADFPGGDSGELYDSIMKVLALPAEMRLFICHDYGPGGRAVAYETTIGEQRANNIHVGAERTRSEFIALRDGRDATLNMPRLIIPALQVNMRAGEVPTDKDGKPMLKVPLNALSELGD